MPASKERIIEEGLPHGAKVVWSDKENRLVLQVPKRVTRPAAPNPQPGDSVAIIDRILAGASKDVTG